jgi:hypothetical protein
MENRYKNNMVMMLRFKIFYKVTNLNANQSMIIIKIYI